jgi:DNA repair exonuclease SbcCD nuclease subunit
VLLLHDEVRGVVPDAARHGDRGYAVIDPVELEQSAWDYVGLGHYHVYRPISLTHASGRAIPCCYSGSLEYASTNPWLELREEAKLRGGAAGKGFVEHDLVTGDHTFHTVEPARAFIDLEAIDGAGLSAEQLDARIADAIRRAGSTLDDAVVRLTVHNVTRHVVRTLDYAPLREVRKRTLHFHLDTRKPDVVEAAPGSAFAGRRATLRDRLAERLQQRPLAPGLDRDRLVQLGLGYLTRAEDAAAAALPVAEA